MPIGTKRISSATFVYYFDNYSFRLPYWYVRLGTKGHHPYPVSPKLTRTQWLEIEDSSIQEQAVRLIHSSIDDIG